jgi:glutathione S-transferase
VPGRSMLNCVLTAKIGESGMAALRIFSYLPNPRIWKATIAGRLCGVEIEVRGASPRELSQWLWDFDARPIAEVPRETLASAERTGRIGFADQKLYKTDAFLKAHPFGTVPASFSPDGCTGIFESNSIMRAVARLGAGRFPIYGRNVYESSRIDAFLDASLVFARDGQIYLLALNNSAVSSELYGRMKSSFAAYLSGIEQALSPQCTFLIGNNVTLADVCFVAEFCLFHNEQARSSVLETAGLSPLLDDEFPKTYPRSAAHFQRLLGHPAFVPDVAGYLEKIARSGGHIKKRDSI